MARYEAIVNKWPESMPSIDAMVGAKWKMDATMRPIAPSISLSHDRLDQPGNLKAQPVANGAAYSPLTAFALIDCNQQTTAKRQLMLRADPNLLTLNARLY